MQVQTPKNKYSPALARIVNRFMRQRKYPVGVIYGNPETGKTDTAVLLAEIGLNEGSLDYVASNFTMEQASKITSLEEVKYWHRHQTGTKLFILDEAGNNDDARSPMSRKNVDIRHEINIARKFKAHWLFILPNISDLDTWKDSPLTGMIIKKERWGDNPKTAEFTAKFKTYWSEELLVARKFPRTSLDFDTLDIAPFTLERVINSSVGLKGDACQVAALYAETGNFAKICEKLKAQDGKDWKPQQVKRALQAYISQTLRGGESEK